jgi:hypothetical protein
MKKKIIWKKGVKKKPWEKKTCEKKPWEKKTVWKKNREKKNIWQIKHIFFYGNLSVGFRVIITPLGGFQHNHSLKYCSYLIIQ